MSEQLPPKAPVFTDPERTERLAEMSWADFRQLGYLQEVNRRLLHPLGLALFVVADEDGSNVRGIGVQDHRDDPEGCAYADVALAEPGTRERAAFIDGELERRGAIRLAALGWVIQPIGPDDATV